MGCLQYCLGSVTPPPHGGATEQQRAVPPVIIIPGAGGNQLEIKLTEDYTHSSFLCKRRWWRWQLLSQKEKKKQTPSKNEDEGKDGYFRLWLDVRGLLPPFTRCFAERISLVLDPVTNRCRNAPGVVSRVPFFGSTKGMVSLDPSFREASLYMGTLVKALEAEGYVDGSSLFGAPYDFRYAPGEHAAPCAVQFLKDLKGLIEKAFETNREEPVVLLSHSLGGLWTLHFLNQQTANWRHKYVRHFVAVSAPWGGTVQVLRTYASGYAEGAPFVDPLVLRAEQRSSESNLWLLPVPRVFKDHELVLTRTRSYSALQLPRFLEDIGYPEGVSLYSSRVPPLIDDTLRAPGVPTSLIFSCKVRTPEVLVYKTDNFDKQPELVFGDGDGTVNLCSLCAVVDHWTAQGGKVNVIKLVGKTHSSILTDKESVQRIVAEVICSKASLQSH